MRSKYLGLFSFNNVGSLESLKQKNVMITFVFHKIIWVAVKSFPTFLPRKFLLNSSSTNSNVASSMNFKPICTPRQHSGILQYTVAIYTSCIITISFYCGYLCLFHKPWGNRILFMFRFVCVFCLVHECPNFRALFVERTLFAPLHYLCFFVKDQWTTSMCSICIHMWVEGLFLVSLFCSIDLFVFLSPPLHCLNYCSFILSLEVG